MYVQQPIKGTVYRMWMGLYNFWKAYNFANLVNYFLNNTSVENLLNQGLHPDFFTLH